MRDSLFEEFDRNGYAVIEDFLTPSEIEELKSIAVKLCKEAPEESRIVFTTKGSTKMYQDKYFLESNDKVRFFYENDALNDKNELIVPQEVALNKIGHALHTDIPEFERLTFSERVKEVCWHLGMKVPAIPQSMYIFKNPGVGGEVKPHQDATFLHTEPHGTIGFWIALDEATTQNGCLQFIPGSHKGGVHRRLFRNPDTASEELIIFDKPSPTYPRSNFTSVPVPKGALVLIHGQVVHQSDENKSEKSRHAYTFHVIETENTVYADNNWLQPSPGKSFPRLY